MSVILGIDQSTSATKALLFTETGELLDKTAVSHQQIYPQPGWVEHDAAEIYRNTLQAVATLLERNKERQDSLLCLSITNQRETIVVFDKTTGEPLHNAIVWQCRRGEAICAELEAAGYGGLVQAKTGLKIDTYFPASKLTWLRRNRPDIAQKLDNGEALVGTIDAYLIYRLTNGRSFATDQTNASRTLLFDINTLAWDAELCQLFGVPLSTLPEVRDSDARFGETDMGGLLQRPLPIVGVMGDSQAALFAQRCFAPGSAKVTFGTGSSVLLNIGNKVAYSDKGIVTAVAWVIGGQPVYAFEGITNFTGATITWLRDQLKLIESVDETEALATAVPDNGGVYLVPAFVGLGAPYWRSDARAAVVGLSPASSKNHVVRAALEGIAFRINDVLALMAKEAAVDLQTVHADGGAVNNRFLMQFVADLTHLTMRASRLPELSALGAVLAGLIGTGVYADLNDIVRLPRETNDFLPVMPSAAAEKLYTGWQTAVQQVLYQPKQG
ncbi:MAG: glycerol kinase GlpK [Ardenticatenaceae bacterium]|nr:glycerol kinase GlpK [Ardenticatenaceae bacterium]MCB9445889.1 glycerol kinase GlpK [Ardenticatenaceae bacterium]